MDKIQTGTFLAPIIKPLYEVVTRALGAEFGVPAELVVGHLYDDYINDSNDVAFICSLPYVEFERTGQVPADPIAAPVLFGDRYGGKPIYFSDVIVGADSPYQSFADLRGKSWSYNEPLSQSGYGVTRHHLVQLGETNGFFGKVIHAGSHRRSMAKVAGGEVDGSAIDSHLLAVTLREEPEMRAALRIVAALGPSTIQPVVVSRRLTEADRQRIRRVLLELHHDPDAKPAFEYALVERFTAVGPKTYDDVRAMMEASRAAGYLEIR